MKCQHCDGLGSVAEERMCYEPCGHCRACGRGDPIGCTMPLQDRYIETLPCPECHGYGEMEAPMADDLDIARLRELAERLRGHSQNWNHGELYAIDAVDAAAAILALIEKVERAEKTTEQLHAKMTCMCGSPMDHSAWEGHSPVSMYDYSLDRERARATKAEARVAELEGLLNDHHQHHLQKGTIGLPDGEGGWIEIDNAAAYCDSALYRLTVAVLEKERGK